MRMETFLCSIRTKEFIMNERISKRFHWNIFIKLNVRLTTLREIIKLCIWCSKLSYITKLFSKIMNTFTKLMIALSGSFLIIMRLRKRASIVSDVAHCEIITFLCYSWKSFIRWTNIKLLYAILNIISITCLRLVNYWINFLVFQVVELIVLTAVEFSSLNRWGFLFAIFDIQHIRT